MTRTIRALPWLLLPLGFGLVIWGATADAGHEGPEPTPSHPVSGRAARYTAGWPDRPREVAAQMIAKYGMPDETTATTLIWHDRGVWKKIAVHRELVRHNFPLPHFDVLEQVIDYRVPADRLDELAHFDGSIVARRTRGELATMCDREAINILALNLAEDVIRGEKDPAAARREMARSAMAALRGDGPVSTQHLMLDAPRVATPEPDADPQAAAPTAAGKDGPIEGI